MRIRSNMVALPVNISSNACGNVSISGMLGEKVGKGIEVTY
jgi:hypothetical protein